MNQIAVIENAPPLAASARSRGSIAIIPRDMDEVFRLATATHLAGMAPESFKSPEQVAIAVMHGMEVGFTPMAAIQSIAVINGKPSIWGDGALGLCQASGLMEEHEEGTTGEGDTLTGWCRVKRIGKKPDEKTFSLADAKTAQLMGKDPWKKYPQRMVMMRARSWALRDNFADVLKGLHIAEEVMDHEPSARHVTAPVPPTPPAIAVAGATVPALAHTPQIDTAQGAKVIEVEKVAVQEEDPFEAMQAAQAKPPIPPAAKASAPPVPPTAKPPVPSTAKPPVPPTTNASAPPIPPTNRVVPTKECDPEAVIREFQDALDAQRDAAGVFEAWQDIVSPWLGDLFPPDLKTLESMRDKKIARLS